MTIPQAYILFFAARHFVITQAFMLFPTVSESIAGFLDYFERYQQIGSSTKHVNQ